jgi:hypothetical protein
MPTARYGELFRHAFMADCEGAVQVSNPLPTYVPGCGPTAAQAGVGATDEPAMVAKRPARTARNLLIEPPVEGIFHIDRKLMENSYHVRGAGR